jgi:hypothetical protein
VDETHINLIMKEWTSGSSYADRIDHLRNGGIFALNGDARISKTTVRDYGSGSMEGDTGDDWFIVVMAPASTYVDRTSSETLTNLF